LVLIYGMGLILWLPILDYATKKKAII